VRLKFGRIAYSSALYCELASMKKILFTLLYCLGLAKLAAWCHRRRVTILCYHGVTKHANSSSYDPKGLHVNYRLFESHLDYLQRHYKIISLSEYLLAREQGKPLDLYSLILTFDDGFRNFLTVAAPMLAARNLPATVFLITDRASEEDVSTRSSTWVADDDHRYLSWSEARSLKEDYGFEFGSHTCSHSPLPELSAADTDRELLDSFNKLVSHLDVARPTLSYPKGKYSNMLAEDAHKLGYNCAVTTDRGRNEFNHDPFTLGRTLIGNHDDVASFAVRVSGLRWWLVNLLRGSSSQLPASERHVRQTLVQGKPGLQVGE
jgi:peptidoglycan/xylan/chitin deacetylase (PgdA/CDA1 family)